MVPIYHEELPTTLDTHAIRVNVSTQLPSHITHGTKENQRETQTKGILRVTYLPGTIRCSVLEFLGLLCISVRNFNLYTQQVQESSTF